MWLHVSGVYGHAYTWVLGGGGRGVITLCQWRGHVRLHVSGVYGHAGAGGNNVISVAWSRAASCLWCVWSRVSRCKFLFHVIYFLGYHVVSSSSMISMLYTYLVYHVGSSCSMVYTYLVYHVLSSCSMVYTYLVYHVVSSSFMLYTYLGITL